MKQDRIIYRTCLDCGSKFTIGIKAQEYFKKMDLKFPKRCKNCRDNRKDGHIIKQCIECNINFEITTNEKKFYSERGLTEPKRCVMCRKIKSERDKNG